MTEDIYWCDKCDASIEDGNTTDEDYRTCDTICCECRSAFMVDEDVTYKGIFYGCSCSHSECGIDDHDGVDISDYTFITKVKNKLVCVHNYSKYKKGKFKIRPKALEIRECWENICNGMSDEVMVFDEMAKEKRDILRALNDAIKNSKNMESEAEEGWSSQMQVWDTKAMTEHLKEIKCMVEEQ